MRADQDELLAGTDAAKMYTVRASDLALRILQESSASSLRAVAFGSKSDVFAAVAKVGALAVQ